MAAATTDEAGTIAARSLPTTLARRGRRSAVYDIKYGTAKLEGKLHGDGGAPGGMRGRVDRAGTRTCA